MLSLMQPLYLTDYHVFRALSAFQGRIAVPGAIQVYLAIRNYFVAGGCYELRIN